MKLNVELLQRVKAHILAEPRRFLMTSWIVRRRDAPDYQGDNGRMVKFAKCGTAACIAGWACILSGENDDLNIRTRAEQLLSIDARQAKRLFDHYEWPAKFLDKYGRANTKERATIAAKRIEHFIKTQGTE